MEWYRLYDKYSTMPDAELRSNVISLSDIGSGTEAVDVITDIDNAEIKLRLLEKAMELGAVFTEEDYARLDCELPSYILVKLAKYGNMEYGSAEEVTEALEGIFDENAKRALYERAYIEDVNFTSEQLDRIGYENIDSAHDEVEETEQGDGCRRIGCLAFLLFGWLVGGKKKRKNS